jgi:hypothetical protein
LFYTGRLINTVSHGLFAEAASVEVAIPEENARRRQREGARAPPTACAI